MSSNEDIRLWDAAAERYAGIAGQPDDSFARRFLPFLSDQLGDPSGQILLDIGCGHGWLAKSLHAQGAQVIGIDGSQALMDLAAVGDVDIRWVVHDLTKGLPAGISDADAAVAHMVLMDLPNIDALLADLHAALRPGGKFVFTLLHPAFFMQPPTEDSETRHRYRKVAGYLNQERWWIESYGGHWHYHRPVAWYVDVLVRHGFHVCGMAEPPSLPHHRRPSTEWTEYERWFAQIPTMLAISAVRA